MINKWKLVFIIEELLDIANYYMNAYCESNDENVLSEDEIEQIEDEDEKKRATELKQADDFVKMTSKLIKEYNEKKYADKKSEEQEETI